MHMVEAALALVDVVGGVGGEVRRLAVRPDQHPVLVVGEVGGPQPERVVGLEEVALLAELLDRVADTVLLVQGALGEPDVEVGPEALELGLLLLELALVARLAERDELLVPPAAR